MYVSGGCFVLDIGVVSEHVIHHTHLASVYIFSGVLYDVGTDPGASASVGVGIGGEFGIVILEGNLEW